MKDCISRISTFIPPNSETKPSNSGVPGQTHPPSGYRISVHPPPGKLGEGYRFPGGGCMNFLMVDNEFPSMSIPPLRKTRGEGYGFPSMSVPPPQENLSFLIT